MANNKKIKLDLIKVKTKEIEQKQERLVKIPIEKAKLDKEATSTERNLNLMKKKVELQMKYPGIVNPNFACEKTPEWQEMIKEELALRMEKIVEDLVGLSDKKAELLNQLNEQETRIKADIIRLKGEIANLS